MTSKRIFWAATFALALSGAEASGQPGLVEWGRVDFTDGSSQFVSNVIDAAGSAACLEPEDLRPADGRASPSALHFLRALDASQTLVVDGLSLNVSNDVVVTAASGLSLKGVGARSLIDICQFGEAGRDRCTFENLTFVGANRSSGDFLPYDGGAIKTDGGRIVLKGCSFSDFVTRFSGGAVSALHLAGDSFVTNCTFAGNRAQTVNGYGGALYASGSWELPGVTLRVCDCRFTDNSAENGGAICTLTVVDDDESPIALAIDGGTVFEKNFAVYEGGAVIAEGAVSADGSNTLFRANRAGLSGGAICVTGVAGEFPLPCAIRFGGVTFADNAVDTNTTWTAGGAIAVMTAGCELSVGGHAMFTNNVATTRGGSQPAFGGAVYTAAGVTNDFAKVLFVDNRSENTGMAGSYGGAISAEPGSLTVDTCVFDCGAASSVSCYGSAVDLNKGSAVILNSTFRRGHTEAISAYRTVLAVTNCVIVGNGLASECFDLYLQDSALSMAHTAYGTKNSAHAGSGSITNCLSGRQAADVYDGESLRLRATGFNPVAGLGLEQVATDFDGIAYGSQSYGTSMGAYETPTERLIVVLDGSRDFDGTTSSNGCLWTWNSYTNSVREGTRYDWLDLAKASELQTVFSVTNWAYGSASVGTYCSTNAGASTITAALGSKDGKTEWLRRLVQFVYTGTISECGEVKVYLDPLDYAWTGSAVTPGDGLLGSLVVTNEVDRKVLGPDEFRCDWYDNVNPSGNKTGGIPQAMLVVTCTNNYRSVITNWFAITAYVTEYRNDGVLDSVVTNGSLAGSSVVAAPREKPGYCLDWQNAKTNATVELYGSVTPLVTTLTMLYETDANGDNVPDKYQRKVVFATVNGYWNGSSNGSDRVVWVTLTNGAPSFASGTWATNGVCTLTSAVVPGVGALPFDRYATTGLWNQTPFGDVVSSTSFPIYFYSPDSLSAPARTRLSAAASNPASKLKNVLIIRDFAVGGSGQIEGAVEAQVLDARDDSPLLENPVPLENMAVEIWGAETLDGEWFKVYDATTDADGVWTVSRTRQTRALGTTTVEKDGRAVGTLISSAGAPQFFKVKLVED